MNETKSSRYGRLLAESAAIVASVLLAFAIQAWWEGRQQNDEDVRLLTAVRDEMRANLASVEKNTVYHRSVQSAERTVLALAGSDARKLTIEYADSLIADLSWWTGSSSWVTGAVSALTSDGRLSEVRDEKLRRTLAEWPMRVDVIRAAEDQEYEFFEHIFMPFMRREGSLPQISDAIKARPGSKEPYGLDRLNFARAPVDHRHLLVSREFQNMTLHRLWIQEDILRWYEEFSVSLNSVIKAIEAELGARA